MNQDTIRQDLQAFKSEFEKVTRAKHPFEIRHFVVGQHENRWKQWYQLCIETDAKWRAIQEAEAAQRLTLLEVEELGLQKHTAPDGRLQEIHNEKLDIEISRKQNQLHYHKSLMEGALKEIADYLALAKEYPEFWGKSEDELVAGGEESYWVDRLSKQLSVDILTFGRAQAGNIACVLQIPEEKRNEILKKALEKSEDYIRSVDKIEAKVQPQINAPGFDYRPLDSKGMN